MFLKYIINRKTFFKGSAILVATTIASYILGLLRDRILAHSFGASHVLDAYNAAFTVPDLLLNIFVAGALSAAFIPIFTDLESTGDTKATSQFINSVLNGSLFVLLIAGCIGFLFAPLLSRLLVPGFEIEMQHTYASLLRILLLSPIIFAISNTLGSVLVGQNKFFWYGLSAALYNLGIIGGTLYLSGRFGIYGVAFGALIGAALHLISRMIGLWNYHFTYKPSLTIDDYYKRFLRLMIPKMIGHPVEQLTFMGYTIIASGLGAGSIVILNIARNFQSAPVAILGINLALAVFPVLARAISNGHEKVFRRELFLTSILLFGATSLAALFVYLIRYPLIDTLIGGGEFGPEAVASTAHMLGVFSLAIPTESLSHLLARAFYALKDSLTPTLVSIGALVIAIITGYIFSRSMGVSGLALGFVCGSLVKVILLIFLLRRETRSRIF